MKKKHIYIKNIFREIHSSMGRFLSIFAIVALGSGFLAGLAATSPDMIDAVDAYYDESCMPDLEIISTMGLTQADVEALEEVEGVAAVMPVYRTDVMMNYTASQTLAARLLSLPEEGETYLNQVTLLEGRMPEKPDECVAVRLKNVSSVPEVGSTLIINTESDTSGTLICRNFVVTGIVDSAYYFSTEKESTTLGSGTINMVLYLTEDAFETDCYTEIFALAEGAADLNSFDSDYKALVQEVQERAESIAEERCDIRYHELTDEPAQELSDARTEYENQKADAEQQFSEALMALETAEDELNSAQEELDAARLSLIGMGYTEELAEAALAQQQTALDESRAQYEANKADYEKSKADSDAALAEAAQELDEAEQELSDIAKPEWYVQSREDNLSYKSFDENSQKVAAIAVVFPVFFFMVAALVALTTMTRMVEEQRIQLGTFKALGYSNAAIAAKYLLYAGLATLLGSAVGLCVGMKLFPAVIWNAYSMMYNQPPLVTPFRWNYAIITFAASLACTMLAAFGACRHSLQECSASLMLPKAPKPGKRVLLERITPLWKHMKFTHKVTVRNLLRYKKRFFMTIVGIAGCTALLLTGFGLSNSINDILDKQYGELNRYDMLVMCKDGSAVNDDDLQNALAGTDCQVAVHQESCDITADDKTLEAYLFVPEDTDMLSEVLTLRERKSGNPLTLSDDSIILTEKAAETMGLSVGDTLTLQRSDGDPVTLTVGGIAENYVYTYVYMTPEQYERLFGMSAEYQVLLVTMSGMDEEAQTALGESVLDCENVSMITLVSSIQTSFRNMVVSIDYIVLVLIICAGLLAFVVLYNLMNINITERQRELATIKVLGFYEGEVGAYVYRETLILSLLGTALGLFLGIFLHAFVVRTAEEDVAMFGRDIYPMSFVYAALLTMLFSVLVCLVMFPKLRKIDMVESLKSIE